MLSDYADPAIKADGVSNEHKSQVQEVTAGVEDDKAKTDKVVSELDTVVLPFPVNLKKCLKLCVLVAARPQNTCRRAQTREQIAKV